MLQRIFKWRQASVAGWIGIVEDEVLNHLERIKMYPIVINSNSRQPAPNGTIDRQARSGRKRLPAALPAVPAGWMGLLAPSSPGPTQPPRNKSQRLIAQKSAVC